MIESAEWLFTALINHGSVLLAATLFLAALGVPLPATLLLLAAGAFVRQGVLALDVALPAAIAAAVAGDACSYALGRGGLHLLPDTLQSAPAWQRAQTQFARWGGWSIFISRFLLTPLALPINLLAGSTRYAWHRFVAVSLAGETLWVVLFGGFGYLFAQQWEEIGKLAGDLVGTLVGVLLMAVGVWALASGLARRTADRQ